MKVALLCVVIVAALACVFMLVPRCKSIGPHRTVIAGQIVQECN